MHAHNTFATLTYDETELPRLVLGTPGSSPNYWKSISSLMSNAAGNVPDMDVMNLGSGTLVPTHLQNWLKRLRKAIEPTKIRYYAVGEYGDATQRPHYHVALFNYPSCRSTQSQYRHGFLRCCVHCHLVQETWGHGNIYLGTLETSSAQYVAGYVTKKMTAFDDPRLNGRHPEFARMSLRPGIGFHAMHEVASTLMKFNVETSSGDVPSALAHGKRVLPLGRYLRRSLRSMVGMAKEAPDATLREQEPEMLALREAAKTDPDAISLKAQILKVNEQKVLAMKGRAKLYKQGKKL